MESGVISDVQGAIAFVYGRYNILAHLPSTYYVTAPLRSSRPLITTWQQLCEPLDGSASNVCGFSTFYNCQERVWVTLSVDFTLCPEPTSGGPTHPKTRDTPSPSAILTSTPPPSIVFTGSPVSQRLPDGGSDGERGCPVNPPQMERCSRDQEGIECKYGCVCCDASTEFDEVC